MTSPPASPPPGDSPIPIPQGGSRSAIVAVWVIAIAAVAIAAASVLGLQRLQAIDGVEQQLADLSSTLSELQDLTRQSLVVVCVSGLLDLADGPTLDARRNSLEILVRVCPAETFAGLDDDD